MPQSRRMQYDPLASLSEADIDSDTGLSDSPEMRADNSNMSLERRARGSGDMSDVSAVESKAELAPGRMHHESSCSARSLAVCSIWYRIFG